MIKLKINKQDLIQPLSIIQSIVDRKSIMNIINNVCLYTKDGFLFIEATDLEISYRGNVPCSVISDGSITVNAKKLYEIIKEFPLKIINIEEIENNWLLIGSPEKAEYKIGGMPSDDFPQFKQIDDKKFKRIHSGIINELLSKTIFSVSLDDNKPNLTGILFEEERKEETSILRMVSSDGHRLTICEKVISDDIPVLEKDVIIPRKSASEIRKFTDTKNDIFFAIDESFLFVKNDNEEIVIRLLNEIYPEYKVVLPDSFDRYFSVNRSVLYHSLKRISILTSDTNFKGVRVFVNKNIMEINSIESKIGEAKEIVEIKYDGEPFSIAFNAKYFTDVLSIMKSSEILVVVNDDTSPLIVKGEDDEGFTEVIMPMSIED